jgi:hypothetical protein
VINSERNFVTLNIDNGHQAVTDLKGIADSQIRLVFLHGRVLRGTSGRALKNETGRRVSDRCRLRPNYIKSSAMPQTEFRVCGLHRLSALSDRQELPNSVAIGRKWIQCGKRSPSFVHDGPQSASRRFRFAHRVEIPRLAGR